VAIFTRGKSLVAQNNARYEATAEALINKGADLKARDNAGLTPLQYAALYGEKEVVDALIAKRADLQETKGTVPALIKALGDTDSGVRASAALALHRIGPAAEEAATALAKALGDPDERVRGTAGSALGQIGRGSIPVLIKALGDPDAVVREGAARALCHFPVEKEPVPALIKALSDPNARVRQSAALALANENAAAKDAIPELERVAANDPDSSVRFGARCAAQLIRELVEK
jgi:HEAT repeat protein